MEKLTIRQEFVLHLRSCLNINVEFLANFFSHPLLFARGVYEACFEVRTILSKNILLCKVGHVKLVLKNAQLTSILLMNETLSYNIIKGINQST